MSYTKTNWVNGQTPLNATNMNNIENGIESATPVVHSYENTTLGAVYNEIINNFNNIMKIQLIPNETLTMDISFMGLGTSNGVLTMTSGTENAYVLDPGMVLNLYPTSNLSNSTGSREFFETEYALSFLSSSGIMLQRLASVQPSAGATEVKLIWRGTGSNSVNVTNTSLSSIKIFYISGATIV